MSSVNNAAHEFYRIVGLKISRMVGHQGIGCRMRLVEAVSGKLYHKVEDGLGLFKIKLILAGPRP